MQDPGAGKDLLQVSDFALSEFINDSNFNHFIDLIRQDTGDSIPPNFDGELMFDGGMVEKLFDTTPDEKDADDSSACTTSTTKSKTADRSKTLVSERQRRSSMKEKLYALRSLVPNITKMDKASIVGDAVSYVQELQMQAKKIKAEIAGLEVSLTAVRQFPRLVKNQKEPSYLGGDKQPIRRNILQVPVILCECVVLMDVFQVEEKEYYCRVACNKGGGVAVALHRALESLLLSCDIRSSNLTTVSDRFVLTFTVQECGQPMNASTLKLWVTSALLNQGFQMGLSAP